MNQTHVYVAFGGSGTQIIGVFDTLGAAAASFSNIPEELKPFTIPEGAVEAWYEPKSIYSVCKYNIKTYGEEQ